VNAHVVDCVWRRVPPLPEYEAVPDESLDHFVGPRVSVEEIRRELVVALDIGHYPLPIRASHLSQFLQGALVGEVAGRLEHPLNPRGVGSG